MGFARWMSSPLGRLARILFGLVLILMGLSVQTGMGFFVAAVGLLPIVAGVMNLCLFAPFFGGPLFGSDLA